MENNEGLSKDELWESFVQEGLPINWFPWFVVMRENKMIRENIQAQAQAIAEAQENMETLIEVQKSLEYGLKMLEPGGDKEDAGDYQALSTRRVYFDSNPNANGDDD